MTLQLPGLPSDLPNIDTAHGNHIIISATSFAVDTKIERNERSPRVSSTPAAVETQANISSMHPFISTESRTSLLPSWRCLTIIISFRIL